MSETAVVVNPCRLCSPLGASLALKGVEGAIPLLHGSQGCATYIRRYMISHYREPVDIASSSFDEATVIFGGRDNLFQALDNVTSRYQPALIGIATTCLSETIGDDPALFLNEYRRSRGEAQKIMWVSTPSYRGSQTDGFHDTVLALVKTFANDESLQGTEVEGEGLPFVNLFPGPLSPVDYRALRNALADFGFEDKILPDYSETLEGGLWEEYKPLPPGGTPLTRFGKCGQAQASIEFGDIRMGKSGAGEWLEQNHSVPLHKLPIPLGVETSDEFFATLSDVSGKPVPEKYEKQRGRLLDAYTDGHKYIFGQKVMIFGEEDLAAALASFVSEIGMEPVVVMTGGKSGMLKDTLEKIVPGFSESGYTCLEDSDFGSMDELVEEYKPDLLLGSSKGYKTSRKYDIPLVRIGFPIHDRFGAGRLRSVGYEGTLELFDRLVNAVIEIKQNKSKVGYTYI